MKLTTGILLIVFSILVGSCSLRYGHVPKVKSGKTQLTVKKHTSAKKLPSIFLEHRKIQFTVPPFAAETKPAEIRQQKFSTVHPRTAEIPAEADTSALAPGQPLTKQDVTLNNTNFYPVLNIALIFFIIALLLFVSVFFTVLLSDILFFILLDTDLILLILVVVGWIAVNYLLFSWLRRRIKQHKKIKTTYNGTEYTQEEINKLSPEIKSRHAVNNLLAALIFLVASLPFLIVPAFTLLTILFLFAAIYFFIRAALAGK